MTQATADRQTCSHLFISVHMVPLAILREVLLQAERTEYRAELPFVHPSNSMPASDSWWTC